MPEGEARGLPETVQEYRRDLKGEAIANPLVVNSVPTDRVQPSAGSALLEKREMKRLLDGVKDIRSCLYNPHVKELANFARLPLVFNGHNWALAPDQWAYLVAPNFKETGWADAFPNLRGIA